jgi:hypothetical protein
MVLISWVASTQATEYGTKLMLLFVFFAVAGWLVARSQAHLVLLCVVTASTVPAIVYGSLLTLPGNLPGNWRAEYVIFLVLALLAMVHQQQTRFRAPIDGPVLTFMIIQGLSVLAALGRGDMQYTGWGPVIRLTEGYSFYFISSRLTSRDQIHSLIWALTAIGVLLSLLIIMTTATGSQELYSRLFADSPDILSGSQFYAQFYLHYEAPRIGYGAGDSVLLMSFAISLVMLFLSGFSRLWYPVAVFTIALRMLVSGQRFQMAWLLATVLLTIVFLYARKFRAHVRPRWNPWILLPLLACALVSLLFSSEMAMNWTTLGQRAGSTLGDLASPEQTFGIQLAWAELLDAPSAWITGFSPFRYTVVSDINLGVLFTVYNYGIGGLIVLLWLLSTSVGQALRLLQSPLLPEERSLACTVVIFIIIYFLNGFFRNMVFNESGTAVIVFSICLGWLQVIWRDVGERTQIHLGEYI